MLFKTSTALKNEGVAERRRLAATSPSQSSPLHNYSIPSPLFRDRNLPLGHTWWHYYYYYCFLLVLHVEVLLQPASQHPQYQPPYSSAPATAAAQHQATSCSSKKSPFTLTRLCCPDDTPHTDRYLHTYTHPEIFMYIPTSVCLHVCRILTLFNGAPKFTYIHTVTSTSTHP